MPSSHLYQVVDIIELILFTNPSSILDIGVGFGKYGFLSREYLELWNRRKEYGSWERKIDGIEVYKEYLTPVHEFIYDKIYIGNALDILPELSINYDLILLIDVIEHFNHEDGVRLLEECKRHGKNIIVSTPKDIGIQEDIFSNPFEIHKFQWTKKHFNHFLDKCFISNGLSLICYLGDNALKLKEAKVNRKIGKYFPFLIPIAKKLRK